MQTLRSRIRLETASWACLALTLALLEGGVTGLLIQQQFSAQLYEWQVNLAVAVATGAPFFANLFSMIWVRLSQGRNKAHLISRLAMICCLCSAGLAWMPVNETGLVGLLILLVIARVCWSGITTLRSVIWRGNYPRNIRARITARYTTVFALATSVAALAAGWLIEQGITAFQLLSAVFALISLWASWRYRHLALRRQAILADKPGSTLTLLQMPALFRADQAFARYMLAMFILGAGNLMLIGLLVVGIHRFTGVLPWQQIMITSAIPMLIIPFAVRWWARLLEGNHIFFFRIWHGAGLTLAMSVFLLALATGSEWLLFIGSACYGLAQSGGAIGWNLGHNDFSDNDRALDYMAVHVTLTGVRGLLAPLLGISFYQLLVQVDLGYLALLLPVSLVAIGTLMFVVYHRQNLHQLKQDEPA